MRTPEGGQVRGIWEGAWAGPRRSVADSTSSCCRSNAAGGPLCNELTRGLCMRSGCALLRPTDSLVVGVPPRAITNSSCGWIGLLGLGKSDMILKSVKNWGGENHCRKDDVWKWVLLLVSRKITTEEDLTCSGGKVNKMDLTNSA